MEFFTNSAEETIALGIKIAKTLMPGDVLLLTGDLSGGKTTITKGIGQGLGVRRIINSPTFNIVKTYQGQNVTLNHFDLYFHLIPRLQCLLLLEQIHLLM